MSVPIHQSPAHNRKPHERSGGRTFEEVAAELEHTLFIPANAAFGKVETATKRPYGILRRLIEDRGNISRLEEAQALLSKPGRRKKLNGILCFGEWLAQKMPFASERYVQKILKQHRDAISLITMMDEVPVIPVRHPMQKLQIVEKSEDGLPLPDPVPSLKTQWRFFLQELSAMAEEYHEFPDVVSDLTNLKEKYEARGRL
jgi:hypothetical protein